MLCTKTPLTLFKIFCKHPKAQIIRAENWPLDDFKTSTIQQSMQITKLTWCRLFDKQLNGRYFPIFNNKNIIELNLAVTIEKTGIEKKQEATDDRA